MYNTNAGRAVTVAGLAVAALGACSKFSEEALPIGDAGAADVADASAPETTRDPDDGGGRDALPDGDAGRVDSSIIVGETNPTAAVSCNGTTCALGEGCCFAASGPSCRPRAACNGFFLACVASATCGSASVCCFDGSRSACATSCGGGGAVCQVGSECVMSACGPVKCAVDGGVPLVPFNLCAETTVLPAARDGVACTR